MIRTHESTVYTESPHLSSISPSPWFDVSHAPRARRGLRLEAKMWGRGPCLYAISSNRDEQVTERASYIIIADEDGVVAFLVAQHVSASCWVAWVLPRILCRTFLPTTSPEILST